ncbi:MULTISPECIES: MATE family efflux transporter [Eubacteriales]|uniref:MATE family efflux transporter n=1 Tax=Eubacteriales TaxID=186802 RepID=UPI000B38CC72|nr:MULTISPECIES: MATE family efflux transporter [Eubacteriales]OUP25634.1 MATE family efflux transporter [Gemmiger sp. An194]
MTKSMTAGSPAKLILLFALPLFIGNLFQQVYNMADAFIVGRMLGVNALAAVGCTGSLTFLIIGFAQGLSAGFSILTAQRFGAGEMDGVRQSYAASLVLGGVISLVLMAASMAGTRQLLVLLQTPPEILEDATRYLIVIFAGIPTTMLFNVVSNVLRALGDSKTPLSFLVGGCVLNILLDVLLILYTPLGVMGAGVATVIAQLLAGAACVVYIHKAFPALRLHRSDWKLSRREVLRHLQMGLPMGFQSSIIAIGSLMLQYALNSLGSTAVAAFTAANKLESLGTLPLCSFGLAMGTFVAQNYGAGKLHRIRTGVLQCSAMALSWSVFMGVVFLVFGRQLAILFVGRDAQVTGLSYIYLCVVAFSMWVLALLFIFRYSLQGLGQSFVPTFAGIMELVMRGVCAVCLVGPFGFTGACLANPMAWSGSAVPLVIAFFITMRRLTLSMPEHEEIA